MKSAFYQRILDNLDRCDELINCSEPNDLWEAKARIMIVRDALRQHWDSEELREAELATIMDGLAHCQYPVG